MPTYQERNGRVRVIVRRKGHAPQSKTFRTKTEAARWARKVEVDLDTGGFTPSKLSVAELMEKYRDEVSVNKPGWKWELTRINKLLKEPWAELPAAECGDAINLWAYKQLRALSPATVNRELNLLSGVFTVAIKRWRIKLRENPVRTVLRPPKTKARKRRVSAAELQALQKLPGNPGTLRWYVPRMVEFAIETGLRLGELCALRWEDVREEERWLYVLPSKNGDDRQVPASKRALELVAQLPRAGELVFPVNAGSVGVIFRNMCREAGITDLHFHDTRHEAVSRLAKKFPILQLAAVIGHRDLKSLQVYYNPTIQELAAHLNGELPPTLPRL